MQGIHGIEESTVYQKILKQGEAKGRAEGEAKGRAEGKAEGKELGRAAEAIRLLLRLGAHHLGTPEEIVAQEIAAIQDVERLEQLVDRVQQAESWQQLLK